MTEKISLGSAGFAQVGTPDYKVRSDIECRVLTEAINKKYGKRIEKSGGRLVWQACPHDFGTYHEMQFHIPEERIKDNTWDLINTLEAFDWESLVLLNEMEFLFAQLPQEIFRKGQLSKDLQDKARELEEYGAVVILPEGIDQAEDKAAELQGKIDDKGTFQEIDLDTIDMATLMDSVVPACCIFGCEVEPDGTCEHGNPSVLLHHGMI